MSLKIALVGYGKMGRSVEREALERGHTISHRINSDGPDAISDLSSSTTDVVIEFTNPDAAPGNFTQILDLGIPLVTGSTGWLDQLPTIQSKVEALSGSFLYSSNFSPGVNMLFKLNNTLAKMMNQHPGYDAFVEERHHRHKKDAPSGTAGSLAKQLIEGLDRKTRIVHSALESRPPETDELSVAFTRAGEIIGTHEVTFISDIDQLSIRHEAFNRRGFALGAVLAAEWLNDRKGFFNFVDIFE